MDTRGLSCPEPVLMVKNAVDAGERNLEILADTNVSMENIVRFLENAGFKVNVKEEGEEYRIEAIK